MSKLEKINNDIQSLRDQVNALTSYTTKGDGFVSRCEVCNKPYVCINPLTENPHNLCDKCKPQYKQEIPEMLPFPRLSRNKEIVEPAEYVPQVGDIVISPNREVFIFEVISSDGLFHLLRIRDDSKQVASKSLKLTKIGEVTK